MIVLAALGLAASSAVLSWPEPTATMKPWVYNWWMRSFAA